MTRRYHKASSASCPAVTPSLPDTLPPMPGYVSAAELADMQLAGLPTSRRRIDERATREGWHFVDRVGRGGGRLYRVSDLPSEAQADLIERRVTQLANSSASIGRPKGTDFFSARPEMASAVEAVLTGRKLAAPRVMELLATQFAELPSLRTLQRLMRDIERDKRALIASVRDPDAYKSKYRVSLGRADADVSRAHECWEMDGTKVDVHLQDGRKTIIGIIDRWSRRASYAVVNSESSQAIRNHLIDTIRRWGVMPESVKVDRGSGFISKSLESALEVLGIEHIVLPPASGDRKPHVERLFGTFTRERAELLDGYAGHNVAEAQVLRAVARKQTGKPIILPKLSSAEMQNIITSWIEGVYHLRVHGSLRMSPMARWQSTPVPPRAAPDQQVLQLALSALVGARTVTKRGIVWKGGRYWSPALAAWMGRDVMVRRDEDELGELYIFTPDNEFIDVAVDATRSGLSEQQFAMAARRNQDEHMKAARAQYREKARSFDFGRARDELLRRDAEAAGKLVHLQPPTRDHQTPAMASMATPLAPAPEAPAAQPARPAPTTAVRSAADKVSEADTILTAHARGNPVDPDRLQWAQIYATSTEYRVEKVMHAEFGDCRQPSQPSHTSSANRA